MRLKVFAAVIAVLVGCTAAPANSVGSPTSNPSVNATARVEATTSVNPTSTTAPASSLQPQSTGVRANALGTLTGDWLFVGKQVPGVLYSRSVQIWAIPLQGGVPKLAFTYDVSSAGSPEGIRDNTPYLRRQFSPDGTQVVVTVNGQLVVVDLRTGQTRALGVDGAFPSWSKDGSRIAFLYQLPVGAVVPPEGAIGVVPAAGGSVKQMAVVGYGRQSVEWSPDGSMMMLTQPDGIAIVEVTSGRVVRRIAEISEAGSSFVHWRTKAPQLAISVTGCERATTKVIALDRATSAPRILVDTGERCAPLNLRDPRWNPAGDEVLYVSARGAVGAMPNEYRTHVVEASSGKVTLLPVLAWEATWTWDGAQIAYIARGADFSYGNAVRLWRRDGTGDRELLRAGDGETFFSLASLSY